MPDNVPNRNRNTQHNDPGQGRPRPQNQRRNNNKSRGQEASAIGATVKGIIAVLITFLIVAIVIMVFAKSLFMSGDTAPKKTGVSTTPTIFVPEETKTATEKVTTKGTKKSKTETEEEEEEEEEKGDSQTITCTGAVYLHPQPTSSSANLLTIPAGAEVKFYRNENGWYYVDYNGTEGYAWNTFFTKPAE